VEGDAGKHLAAGPAVRRLARGTSQQPDGQVNGERDGFQRRNREDRDDHRCGGGRGQLGRAILLGLELLVAGDIVRTVAASPSLTRVAILAAIVFILTFLSFSLEVETTGRWPWQKRNISAS
jgi:hypothetical protein